MLLPLLILYMNKLDYDCIKFGEQVYLHKLELSPSDLQLQIMCNSIEVTKILALIIILPTH